MEKTRPIVFNTAYHKAFDEAYYKNFGKLLRLTIGNYQQGFKAKTNRYLCTTKIIEELETRHTAWFIDVQAAYDSVQTPDLHKGIEKRLEIIRKYMTVNNEEEQDMKQEQREKRTRTETETN